MSRTCSSNCGNCCDEVSLAARKGFVRVCYRKIDSQVLTDAYDENAQYPEIGGNPSDFNDKGTVSPPFALDEWGVVLFMMASASAKISLLGGSVYHGGLLQQESPLALMDWAVRTGGLSAAA